MTPEEITALVNSSIAEAISGLKEDFTKANQGLASSLSKEIKKTLSTVNQPSETETPEVSDKLTLKTLQNQLVDLQAKLDQKDKETISVKKSQAISQVIAESKALNPKSLQKLLNLEFGDYLKEENGTWYVVKGDDSISPLKDALNSYLNSDEGKFYLPPSNVNGSGSTETKPAPVNPTQKIDTADALFQAFS